MHVRKHVCNDEVMSGEKDWLLHLSVCLSVPTFEVWRKDGRQSETERQRMREKVGGKSGFHIRFSTS